MGPLSSAPAVLTSRYQGVDWGWFGIEVDAAVDLTKSREFADRDEDDRVQKAVDDQRAWLNQLWSIQPSGAAEFRWLADGSGSLRLVVLARLGVSSGQDLTARIGGAMGLLSSAPSHVLARPITDPDLLRFSLAPFEMHRGGVADIRKRSITATPSRPDAGVAYYYAFQPFGGRPADWPGLLRALSASRDPVLLSIGLRPATVEQPQLDLLLRIASQYRRLAERGQPSGVGVYKKLKEMGPDAFAVDAQHLYQDAARRLQGYGFEIRVSVASSGTLEPGLLTTAVEVIGGSERMDGEKSAAAVAKEFRGASAEIVVPTDTSQFHQFARNVNSLGFEEWGGHEVWSRPAPPPLALRPLARMTDVVEASAAAYLPIAATGVLPGFPVKAPAFNVEVSHDVSGDSIRLGTQVTGGRDAGPVDISLDSLRTHAFFAGTTGAGKSTAVLSLLHQLWTDHRIPFLVLEPVNTVRNDYRQLLTSPGFEDAVVLTAGVEGLAPLRLNPLQVPAMVTVGEHMSNVLGAFDAAFGLFDPLPAIYREALTAVYAEAGIPLNAVGDDSIEWPTLREFEAELVRVVAQQNYAGEVQSNIEAASLIRIRQLAAGPAGSVFDCRRSTPLTSVLLRPAILELGHLGTMNEGEQNLVTAMTLVTMAEQLVSMPRNPGLNHVTVVEEAHRFLKKPEPAQEGKGDPSGAAAALFGNLLAEVRKHGEALVVVDQDPDKLIPDTYKNTNLKMMFRLQSEDDRRRVGSAMGFDEDHLKAAGNLDTFMGFAHVAGMDRPAHLRSSAAELLARQELAEIATNEEVANRFRFAVSSDTELHESLRPYRACSGCSAVCEHRDVAAMAAGRNATKTRFAELVDQMPGADEPGWEDWGAKVADDLGGILAELGQSDAADARGCLFLHVARKEWDVTVDTTQLVLDFWQTLTNEDPHEGEKQAT